MASGLACSEIIAILIRIPPAARGPSRPGNGAGRSGRGRSRGPPCPSRRLRRDRRDRRDSAGRRHEARRGFVEMTPALAGTASTTSVVASATTGMPRCIASSSDRSSEVQRQVLVRPAARQRADLHAEHVRRRVQPGEQVRANVPSSPYWLVDDNGGPRRCGRAAPRARMRASPTYGPGRACRDRGRVSPGRGTHGGPTPGRWCTSRGRATGSQG